MTDFSSGLTENDDHALAAPEDVPGFNETFCFFGYDPDVDLAFFVHIQAKPQPWKFHLVVYLPGAREFLECVEFSEDRIPRRPGGQRFHAECLEPFRRWRVAASVKCGETTLGDMLARRQFGEPKRDVELDIDVHACAPLWCIGDDDATPEEHGQRGFRVHHQQLMQGAGVIRIDGVDHRFSGPVWRDHSRGPRTLTEWGTHDLNSAWFPAQRRGLGLLRQVDIHGKVTSSFAYIVRDGMLESADIIESTPLSDGGDQDQRINVALRSADGEVHRMQGVLQTQFLTGIGPGSWLTEGQARWTYNGEVSHGICERSCRGLPVT